LPKLQGDPEIILLAVLEDFISKKGGSWAGLGELLEKYC
jgi:hypothetical protein